MVQQELLIHQKLDDKKWKEERKINYLTSKILNKKIANIELVSLIGKISMDNCYETDLMYIYNTGEHPKIEE